MILTYTGGVYLPQQTDAAHFTAHAAVPEVYLPLEAGCTLAVDDGARVCAGDTVALLADQTPILSPVSGRFSGVFTLEQGSQTFARVETDANAEQTARQVREPETRPLSELSADELLEAIRACGIYDIYRGDWLWRRAAKAVGHTRRVVVDVTDDNGWSFTNYRTALRAPGSLLGGAKVLLHLLGATKIILAVDHNRKKTVDVFRTMINDPALTVTAELDLKYPLREQTLFDALYARSIPKGKTADDLGVFIVRAQTAQAVYEAILTGKPQLTRWLTAAGEGFGKPGVYEVPFGSTWKQVLSVAKFKGGAYETRLDSPLQHIPAKGVVTGTQESVLASLPVKRTPSHCIACGSCADVCPMRLQPFRVLRERNFRSLQRLVTVCIDCGCCSYICPAQLPLRELVAQYRKNGTTPPTRPERT